MTLPLSHSYQSFSDLVHPSTSIAQRNHHRQSLPRSFSSSSPSSTPVKRGNDSPNNTTKILDWRKYSSMNGNYYRASGRGDIDDDEEGDVIRGVDEQEWLSTLNLILLTIGLAGAQLAWTVEMAFGTPYLLSLGLTKEATSLVWIAGPLSGLLVQPVIGALSDSSTSRYRRRAFILGSACFVLLSTLIVAYAVSLATLLNTFTGLGSWDPDRSTSIKSLSIIIAVGGFYFLDFSLNGLQASLRALILDRSPAGQQNVANAWQGRMTHLANIFGYSFGYLNLSEWTLLGWIGGGQFRKLAVLACGVMIICVGLTCYTQEEMKPEIVEDEKERENKWLGVIRNIRVSIRDLPTPVRRVCAVQFFAWSAYFPFLFYSTTWVAEIFYASIPEGRPIPSPDTATRAGSFTLLIFAVVAFAAGSILPWLSTLGRRPFIISLSSTSSFNRYLRFALMKMTPRNFWTLGLTLYGLLMVGTFWVESVQGAMVIIAGLGIPWAINCWVPFALVMESIRDLDTLPRLSSSSSTTPQHPSTSPDTSSIIPNYTQPFRTQLRQPSVSRERVASALTDCSPLLSPERFSTYRDSNGGTHHRRVTTREENEEDEHDMIEGEIGTGGGGGGNKTPSGGTILGIHNLSIVIPQFFVALVAMMIFKALGSDPDALENGGGLRGSGDVVWVLRFGGAMSLIGAVVSRWIKSTGSERSYVEMLREQIDRRAQRGEE